MATTRVEHGGTVNHMHRHHHTHEHVIVNNAPGAAEAARGGTGRAGLSKAQAAFHETESGGGTPRE